MRRQSLIYGFWDRFYEACDDKGVSKKDVAEFIGVDRKTLYRSSNQLNLLSIAKACVRLNVSADWLLGIVNEKRPLYRSMEGKK